MELREKAITAMLVVATTLIPLSTASAVLIRDQLSSLGFVALAIINTLLVAGIGLVIEGVFREEDMLIKASRYFVYAGLAGLTAFYLAVAALG